MTNPNILLFSLALVVAGCSNERPRNAILLQAEQEVNSHPVHTVEMIYKLEADTMGEADRSLCHLLTVEALHKAGVMVASDSLLEQSRQFFAAHGDRKRCLRATLHQGISYYEDRRYPEAVKLLKEAEQMVRSRDEAPLRHDVFEALGRINAEADNWRVAVDYMRRALAAARQANHANWQATALTQLAELYGRHGDVKRQNAYAQQTEPLLRRVDKRVKAMVLTSLAAMNLRVGYDLTARQQLEEAYKMVPQELTVKLLGDLCHKMGRKAEAADYWYMALNGFDLDLQVEVYEKLIAHFKEMHQADRALDLSQREVRVLQMKNERGGTASVVEMQRDFDNHASTQRLYRRIIALLLAAMVLMVAVLVLGWYHRRRVGRLSRLIESLNSRYNADLNSYQQTRAELAQLQHERQADELLIAEKQRQISMLEGKLAGYQEDRQPPERWNVDGNLLNAETVVRLHALAAKGKLPEPADWQQLRLLMPAFTALLEEHHLNGKEMHVCQLIKLRFIPSEMAALTASSPQAVTNMRVRLMEKLFGQKGGARDFDRRIREIETNQPS